MGGSSVLERLATLESEVGFIRSTVAAMDTKLDRLSDLVDLRNAVADTKHTLYTTLGKYGATLVAGIAGLLGGTQAPHVSELFHKLAEAAH